MLYSEKLRATFDAEMSLKWAPNIKNITYYSIYNFKTCTVYYMYI